MQFIDMKRVLIPLILAVGLFSCGNKIQTPEGVQNETPEAIEEDYGSDWSASIKRGRYYDNILERLYKEAVEKNDEVGKINESILLANSFYGDSLVDYKKYINLNEEYWTIANNYITAISDSTLRNELKSIFDKAEVEYCESKKELLYLNDKIALEKEHFDNQVKLLKLMVTLTMIQNYQVNEIPDSSTMNSVLIGFGNANKEIEKFVK